ncbi:S-adenosylmethionine-dependent methyltransferase [Kineococcus radiotolerans]|uniref:S-adenosylmethionine-dependent methyltransferase n=1 Tax=Kineococcus radiotolerans TaxID=131568 RepID=A0A7W4TNI4_KINRA|nr:methyltransferase domain-containing protein [Kineococcus radiotolerans]MBB2901782.1 S-adenosylmethionine-dependent methyltransferase [Kineococcus radiotolerans]
MTAASGEAAAWALWQDSPWGRLRYRVVARVLREWCAELGGEPLRVLDAGGGDGRDAVQFALAGHAVTVLDRSPEMLALARAAAGAAGVGDRLHTVAADLEDLTALAALTRHREGGSGSFDVVLCHDVLQHRRSHEQVRADVATLTSSVRPGGLVSLLAPDPAADVVATVLREGPAAAWVVLDAERALDPGTGRSALRLSPEFAEDALTEAGCDVAQRAGILAVTTLLEEAERVDDRAAADLEELEVELSRREQFRGTARYWLIGGRRR